MKRSLVFCSLLFLAFTVVAQDEPSKTDTSSTVASPALAPSVFLESDPIGARVRINGLFLPSKTPVLVRGLAPGKYLVSLFKDGYQPWDQEVEIRTDALPVVKAHLFTTSVALIFPESSQALFGTESQSTDQKQFRLPAGQYRIDGRGTAVTFQPVFPEETLLTFSSWMIPISAASTGLFTVHDIAVDLEAHGTYSPSPGTVASGVLFFGNLFWNLALQDRKNRFLKENSPMPSPRSEVTDVASAIFQKAEAQLQESNLTEAAQGFSKLVKDFPESGKVPNAWFYLARIHTILGDRALAKGEYRLVAEVFQQSDVFDKAHKALSDLQAFDGNFVEALYHLNQMVYIDPIFDKDEIEARKIEIQDKLEAKAPSKSLPPKEVPSAP